MSPRMRSQKTNERIAKNPQIITNGMERILATEDAIQRENKYTNPVESDKDSKFIIQNLAICFLM
jgi:hypothetical protein